MTFKMTGIPDGSIENNFYAKPILDRGCSFELLSVKVSYKRNFSNITPGNKYANTIQPAAILNQTLRL